MGSKFAHPSKISVVRPLHLLHRTCEPGYPPRLCRVPRHRLSIQGTFVRLIKPRFIDRGRQCAKVRCLHCGFTRAKNTTRQIEHLQECQAYLNSPEASAHINENANMDGTPSQSVLNGTHPN